VWQQKSSDKKSLKKILSWARSIDTARFLFLVCTEINVDPPRGDKEILVIQK
jgi:hypothetical protein